MSDLEEIDAKLETAIALQWQVKAAIDSYRIKVVGAAFAGSTVKEDG